MFFAKVSLNENDCRPSLSSTSKLANKILSVNFILNINSSWARTCRQKCDDESPPHMEGQSIRGVVPILGTMPNGTDNRNDDQEGNDDYERALSGATGLAQARKRASGADYA